MLFTVCVSENDGFPKVKTKLHSLTSDLGTVLRIATDHTAEMFWHYFSKEEEAVKRWQPSVLVRI